MAESTGTTVKEKYIERIRNALLPRRLYCIKETRHQRLFCRDFLTQQRVIRGLGANADNPLCEESLKKL